MENQKDTPKKKKLFGVTHPLGKAIIYILFIILTGGLGLIALLFGHLGDQAISKYKAHKNSGAGVK